MNVDRTSRRSPLVWVGPLAFFGLVAALAAAMLFGQERIDPMVGQSAPTITAPLLSGAEVEGAHVVNFWATWCTPCLAEHPVLMSMKEQGIPVVGVAYNDDASKIADYLAREGNPFAVLYLDNGEGTVANWGIRGVPETFAVGSDGLVQARVTGALEEPLRPRP